MKTLKLRFNRWDEHVYEKLKEYCYSNSFSINACIKYIILKHLGLVESREKQFNDVVERLEKLNEMAMRLEKLEKENEELKKKLEEFEKLEKEKENLKKEIEILKKENDELKKLMRIQRYTRL